MFAIAMLAFAAHVIAWVVLPDRKTAPAVDAAPALGASVAVA